VRAFLSAIISSFGFYKIFEAYADASLQL